jgi:hypothetical protein
MTNDSVLSSRRGIAILLLLSLVQFMDILDSSILNIAPAFDQRRPRRQPAGAAVGRWRENPRLRQSSGISLERISLARAIGTSGVGMPGSGSPLRVP